MFLDSSRYAKVGAVTVTDENGRQVKAVMLRRLPYVAGKPTVAKGNDRLDIIALRQFKDASLFWHVADANTELEANKLVDEVGETILVPDR
jgi:hypothetical protein